MPTLKEIERVFVCENNALAIPPFTTTLPAGGTVVLCKRTVSACHDRDAYLISAVVNWSVTFTAPVGVLTFINQPGTAQVTFVILRDGTPIYNVIQTANEAAPAILVPFVGSTTTFSIAALLHLDCTSLTGFANPHPTFTLQATNIILTPPILTTGIATVTAAAGPVTLVIEEIETHH